MDEILTPGEQRLINAAILSSPEGLSSMKVDYTILAERAGYKSYESARVNFGRARRKLISFTEGGPDAAKPATASKESPSKVTKKTKKAATSPAKASPAKGKGAKKDAKKEKDEAVEESKDNDAEEAIVKDEDEA